MVFSALKVIHCTTPSQQVVLMKSWFIIIVALEANKDSTKNNYFYSYTQTHSKVTSNSLRRKVVVGAYVKCFSLQTATAFRQLNRNT
ncbi:hypothetical protein NQ317_010268 [Molorchus minor]|uniref:Uncharacterized protein n=1 Tax=Molorchus minor TaxID=1323400 RepID=A0ABQ9JFF3_9CUCU|nr:hypothetical protein NQ317_010268 [Molorchus minor]